MRTQARILVAALGFLACVSHANTTAAADQDKHRPPVEVIPSDIYDPLGLVSRGTGSWSASRRLQFH